MKRGGTLRGVRAGWRMLAAGNYVHEGGGRVWREGTRWLAASSVRATSFVGPFLTARSAMLEVEGLGRTVRTIGPPRLTEALPRRQRGTHAAEWLTIDGLRHLIEVQFDGDIVTWYVDGERVSRRNREGAEA